MSPDFLISIGRISPTPVWSDANAGKKFQNANLSGRSAKSWSQQQGQEDLFERGETGLFIVKNFEEFEQADHLKRLEDVRGRLDESDTATLLLGQSLGTNQDADATGVHEGNFSEIDEDAGIAVVYGVFEGAAKRVDRFAER